MSYLWGLFLVTTLNADNFHYEWIATYYDREACELALNYFVEQKGIYSGEVRCIKVDE